jgi:hypothetical protein
MGGWQGDRNFKTTRRDRLHDTKPAHGGWSLAPALLVARLQPLRNGVGVLENSGITRVAAKSPTLVREGVGTWGRLRRAVALLRGSCLSPGGRTNVAGGFSRRGGPFLLLS